MIHQSDDADNSKKDGDCESQKTSEIDSNGREINYQWLRNKNHKIGDSNQNLWRINQWEKCGWKNPNISNTNIW